MSKRDWEEMRTAIRDSETETFSELVKKSGLNTEQDLRYANFSGVDFSGSDLRGYNFTGARLRECTFKNTLIRNAHFDRAEINGTNLREAKDWDDYVAAWYQSKKDRSDDHLPPLSLFQDAPFAPEMISIPPGKFLMGSPEDEKGRLDREGAQHEVTIAYPFAVGRYAVTFAEWDYFVKMSGYKHRASDKGWGRGNRPVINVSWDDAKAYVHWLKELTGYDYRLLSEAEWEYVATAGTTTRYWWGNEINKEQANYVGNLNQTVPVNSFEPNPWGLYQVHGNVLEWCEDAYHSTYEGAPGDGSAWIDNKRDEVSSRVLRGGSWFNGPRLLRSANRYRNSTSYRSGNVGFRVSRTLRAPGT